MDLQSAHCAVILEIPVEYPHILNRTLSTLVGSVQFHLYVEPYGRSILDLIKVGSLSWVTYGALFRFQLRSSAVDVL